jgi:hypothetical protein
MWQKPQHNENFNNFYVLPFCSDGWSQSEQNGKWRAKAHNIPSEREGAPDIRKN